MATKNKENNKPETRSRGKNSKPATSASTKRSYGYTSLNLRIGEEFQVDLSEYKTNQYSTNDKEVETLFWKPSPTITDQDLQKFVNSAYIQHSFTIEQALGILCWYQYDLYKALACMKSCRPMQNGWTERDKELFDNAYQLYEKNFTRIRNFVYEDKSEASIVNFYYTMWKKDRQYKSLTDSNITSNSDQSMTSNLSVTNGQDDDDDSNTAYTCCNCDLITGDLRSTLKGMLCDPCYVFWKESGGLMRPDLISELNRKNNDLPPNGTALGNKLTSDPRENNSRKPPKDIYLNYEELINLVEVDIDQTFDMLDKELHCLKKEVQQNKQFNADLIMKLADEIEPKDDIIERLIKIDEKTIETPSWTAHEITLVIQGFSKYGNDFAAISQVLQTKSENSVKLFHSYSKEHLNLDKLVLNNPKDSKSESILILNELTKLNRPDLPTIINEATKIDASYVKTKHNLRKKQKTKLADKIAPTEEQLIQMDEEAIKKPWTAPWTVIQNFNKHGKFFYKQKENKFFE